jgi:hypothetical protein
MDMLYQEIQKALDARLFYLAVVVSLTIPDICAALQSPNAETENKKYKNWCNAYILKKYPKVTAEDLYGLRNGVLHTGRSENKSMKLSRIAFTLPTPPMRSTHDIWVNNFYFIDAAIFCNDMIESGKKWQEDKKDDPNVLTNMTRLVQLRPNGWIDNWGEIPVPIIA